MAVAGVRGWQGQIRRLPAHVAPMLLALLLAAGAVMGQQAPSPAGGAGCEGADRTGDGVVAIGDMLDLLAAFGSSVDGDVVDISDLLFLLARFGDRCAAAPQGGGPLPSPGDVFANVRTRSPHGDYTAARVADGGLMYADRAFRFDNLPPWLNGCPGVLGRNNDKHEPPTHDVELSVSTSYSSSSADFLCFDLQRTTTLYVVYDATVAQPPAVGPAGGRSHGFHPPRRRVHLPAERSRRSLRGLHRALGVGAVGSLPPGGRLGLPGHAARLVHVP